MKFSLAIISLFQSSHIKSPDLILSKLSILSINLNFHVFVISILYISIKSTFFISKLVDFFNKPKYSNILIEVLYQISKALFESCCQHSNVKALFHILCMYPFVSHDNKSQDIFSHPIIIFLGQILFVIFISSLKSSANIKGVDLELVEWISSKTSESSSIFLSSFTLFIS
jgi:hypothetical protein